MNAQIMQELLEALEMLLQFAPNNLTDVSPYERDCWEYAAKTVGKAKGTVP